jgi:PAS domain S-box-containing protein
MGGGSLLGWWVNNASLKSIVPGSSPLKPNIAVGILLCGGVLVFLSLTRSAKPARICAAAAGIIVAVLGGLTLGEHFLGWSLGVDRWFLRSGANETSQLLRMAPATALCFVLTGAMFLAQSQLLSAKLSLPLVTGLSAALAFIGMVAIAGLCLELLFGPRWNLMGMNLSGMTAAVGFLLLGAGLLGLLQSQGQLLWSLDGFTTMGFGIGMLLVVMAAAMAFSYTRRMLETTTSLAHRQEVLGKIQELYADMSELSNGQRVYLITGDEQSLKGRGQLKAEAGDDAASARKLTSDNPNQQHRLDLLEPLIRQRIDWEEQLIGIRSTEGFPAAAQLMGTGQGIKLSAEILRLLNQMEQEEYRLLGLDRKQAEMASATAFSILPFGVFLSLAVLALGLSFLNAGVADQKQAEKALRASEAQLQTIVENLEEGVIVADLDGRLLQWNRAALQLHGYSSSEQDRRHFPELVDTFEIATLDGLVLPVEEWPLARILRDKKLHNLELRLHRIGSDWERIFDYGGTLVHDERGQPRLAIVTLVDITERKLAEANLWGSEERYRSLFESNPNPMWVYDAETLSFLAVNAAAIRHYGFTEREFMAMTLKDIRPADDLPALMDNLSQAGEGLDETTQWRHRKKDGGLIDVEITSHELIWLGRGASLVLINDITARKRAEEQLHQLNIELEERVLQRTAELESANKELEAFSYSVSHDLRSPLRTVDGFSQAVLEDYGPQIPVEGRRYLQTIRDGAQRMGVLIDDLLTFSRLSRLPLHKQNVDLARMARDTFAELDSEKGERKIELKIGELPEVHGDPALLKQVWVNLLSNALKYTRKRETAIIEVGSKSDNGSAICFVSDNGTGFDMQYARKLFGVFQRLHRADEFEGTGVGLAIVQRVINRHGGRVWAEAAEGKGATFYFTLERAKQKV